MLEIFNLKVSDWSVWVHKEGKGTFWDNEDIKPTKYLSTKRTVDVEPAHPKSHHRGLPNYF